MDRTELLDNMRSGRVQLEAALAAINQDDMATPVLPGGWSVKDLIAHIGWWERRIVRLYDILGRGETPNGEPEMSVDELNAKVFAEHHERPLAEIQHMEQAAYQALLSLAENAPEEDLFEPQRFAWTEGSPFANWIIGNSYGHYEEHLPDLPARPA